MAIKISLGLNDKDSLQPIMEVNKAVEVIVNMFDNATIIKGVGVYTHEDGRKTVEDSLHITLYDKSMADGRMICSKLAKQFNQESLALVEIHEVAEFIGV